MTRIRNLAVRRAILASVATMAMLPAAALAQTTAPDDTASEEDAGADSEIVVTGTLVRGAPPVGSNLISVGQDKIAQTGSTTANELLATLPQVTNLFNNVPTARLGVAVNNIQVVRPNLRNLASETGSSASTLVLFDGHRISAVGVTQNAVDPDIIPPIAIERVEVVTDGGSSTYGSDAVGGVINFITRKRFDGLKVTSTYGFADNYYQVQAGAIVGKDWGSGSIFAAYNYQHNDSLFAHDLGFIRDVDWFSASLTPRGRSCTPGNVQIAAGGVTNQYALPNLTSTTPNACDYGNNTVVPASTRHGALVGLHQELSPGLTVDLRSFYGQRATQGRADAAGSVSVTGGSSASNPRQFYYTQVPGQSATATQTVFFNLNNALGTSVMQSGTKFEEWGTSAEFTAKLSDSWQLRTLFNYSESRSDFHIQGLNTTLLNSFGKGTTAATAINFYNPGTGANDAANIRALIDTENAGQSKESLLDLRAIIDGTLFTLPGGEVKLAAGYEHIHDAFRQRTAPANTSIGSINAVAFTPYVRSVDSAFGEVQVPIVGPDNQGGFIHSLTLAGSVRYDHYSDFGSTTNPKIGVTFKPVEWLGLRGNYNTSFNAPSPNDQLGALRNTAQYNAINAFVKPGDTPTAVGVVSLQGSNPGLVPQTAKSWSLGVDLDPPFLSGFHASVNYYNVKFKDVIGIPTPNSGIFANFPNNVTSAPGGLPLSTIQNFLNSSGAPNASAILASVTTGCTNTAACPNVYELVDFRQGNYGSVNVQGLDFATSYRMPTGFGGLDFAVSGNYQLSRKTQTGAGSPVVNQLETTNLVLPSGLRIVGNASPRLTLQASAGATVGALRAQVTLNHTSGYKVLRCDTTTTPACNPSATGVATSSGILQDRVSAYNTVNLFLKYAVPSDSWLLKDLEFTVNVNNLLDTDPPLYKAIGTSTPGYANGFTLGRLVQFGLSKKF
ncbi:TonB-dependent receptor domain-containing protein [Novosphingobium sp. TH158]|uniref:TonB-dependent receptor domain-containing protein n=1 Tax=Novosphingobium sp. TH158 TaxID=2067455 RepID=UPI0013044D6B|nr:TonB-dependent receptor [Novosphingobium sp. TH158]